MGHSNASALPGFSLRPLPIAKSSCDPSPARLLAVDRDGRIVHGNPGWDQLMDDLDLTGEDVRVGGDYLAACRSGWGGRIPEIRTHGGQVAALLDGADADQLPDVIYSCLLGNQEHWFRASATPLTFIPGGAVLIMHNDVTKAVHREADLSRQAFFDALTGLPNYALFCDRLNTAIAHGSRSGEPLATMFIDLDDFKAINDTFGHLSGNRVLSEVARRLSGCLRECDTVARLGGDEFGMLLPGIGNRDTAASVAEKITAVLAPPFHAHDDRTLFVTASIGIAFHPEDGISLEGLMHTADQAMYRAKSAPQARARGSMPGLFTTAGASVFRHGQVRDSYCR